MLNIPENLKSFLDTYRHQAQTRPDETAYIFLEDGEKKELKITYRELHDQALAIAQAIRQHADKGERVVLIYQPGVEFIFAFTACIFAGVIAVPVYPPQGPKDWPRFIKIVQDADVKLFCTSSFVFKPFQSAQKMSPQIAHLPCLATDQVETTDYLETTNTEEWQWPDLNKDDLVFLQYTSGSTGDPKGVMVSHGNLLHNQDINVTGYQHGDNLTVVSWLPQYHDMGLIGNILLSPYTGRPLVLMSPMAFLQKPLRWLQAISKYKATASGAPNFAYELCLRKVKDEDLPTLDLSSWDFIYNGAEFIRTSTIERFYERFKSCGLKKQHICPIYGLAESTLIVTAADKHAMYESLFIDSESLHRGKIEILTPTDDNAHKGRWMTGCGKPFKQDVRIVNPETKRLCAELTVGEVWVKGGSVCQGYWGRPETTEEVFNAYTSDTNEGPYMRTGDLGFLKDGELYISGRHKEVIILDGRNLYPQDIEDVIQKERPALRKGCGAAFSTDDGDVERLVLVQEMSRGVELTQDEFDVLCMSIRAEVLEVFGVNLYGLVFIKQGTFLKTSSGKIRRRAMREKLLQNKLKELYRSMSDMSVPKVPVVKVPVVENASGTMAFTGARNRLEKLLASLVAPHVNLTDKEIDISRPLSEYGMDSKTLVGLSGEINDILKLDLAPRVFYDYPTISALVGFLSGELGASPLIEEMEAVDPDEPIAIIGMSCRFPGQADSVEAYWQLLNNAVDAISEVPSDRWDVKAYYDPAAGAGKMSTRWGGFLKDVDQFDAGFFNIAPREANWMDPQQRLLMETSWECLERASIPASSLAGSKTGVFVGISNNDYDRIRANTQSPNEAYAGTGNAFSIAANRLSYFYDLHGPSLAIDTACSSSLVAIHQACQSLRSGESHLAFAGGVNLILTPDLTVTFSQSKMMAADGRCKTFDDSADGYVRGEGCGVVLLKRLSDAKRDGNNILAIVKGSGVSQDGRSNGLTAPNGPSQEIAIKQALRAAGATPDQVDYVEAHGTGTALGDPIEVQALQNVYGQARNKDNPLIVGSVKTNIGHLEAAAGIAGVIKTVQAVQAGVIPAHKHFQTPNRLIPWDQTNIQIPAESCAWPQREGKTRLAGVSSFGFGGTNSHVLIEQYLPEDTAPAESTQETEASCQTPQAILCLSARTKKGLQSIVDNHQQFLAAHSDIEVMQYCYSTNIGRDHFPYRLAIQGSTLGDLKRQLEEIDWLSPANGVYISQRHAQVNAPRQAWLFTGQGSQYVGMAENLYQSQPVFRNAFDRCNSLYESISNESLTAILFSEDPEINDKIHQTQYTQPLLFCLQYALSELWLSWGCRPDYLLGHSVGEYAAACIAGVFSLEDAIRLIEARGRLIQNLEKRGSMVAVFAHPDDVKNAIGDRRGVSVAAFNGPGQIVIAGDEIELDEVVASLESRKIETRQLQVSHGFHSPLMAPMIEAFKQVADAISYAAPEVDMVSTLTGHLIQDEIASSAYWCSHILAPVLFEQGIDELSECQADVFLELGPSNTLIGMGKRCKPAAKVAWLSSLRQTADDCVHIAGTVSELYVAGASLNWAEMLWGERPTPLTLPTYPFQRQHFWLDTETNASGQDVAQVPRKQDHFLLGNRQQSPRLLPGEMHFSTDLHYDGPHFVQEYEDERLSIRLPIYLAMAFSVGATTFRKVALSIQDVEIFEDISLSKGESRNLQTFVDHSASNEIRMKCYSPEPVDEKSDNKLHAERAGESPWKLIAGANIMPIQTARKSPVNVLESLQDRINRSIDAQEYYENCRDRGLYYCAHESLLVEQLYVSENEALGRTNIVPDRAHWSPMDSLPYAYIYACFQVIGSLCYEDSEHTFLPYRLSRVEFFEIPPSTGWVHVQRNAIWDDEERHLDIDFQWLNDAGKPIVKVTGLKLKAAKTAVKGLKEQLRTMSQSRRLRTLREFLMRIVSKALSVEEDLLDENRPLMELGMDSLIAMEILGRVRFALEIELNVVKLQEGASIVGLANLLDHKLAALYGEEGEDYIHEDVISPLVVIQQGEPGRIPLILIHPIGGSVFCYAELAKQLGEGQPVYAIQAHAFIDEESAPESIEEMVTEYLSEIRRVQPYGPYLLGGWSLGGIVALELASRLQMQGEAAELVALIDSAPEFKRKLETPSDREAFLLNLMSLDMGVSGTLLTEFMQERVSTEQSLQALFKEAQKRGIIPPLMPFDELTHSYNVMKHLLDLLMAHDISSYEGSASLFKAEAPLMEYRGLNDNLDWDKHIAHIEQVQTLEGNHFTLLDPANVGTLASYLRKSIRSKVSDHNRLMVSELAPSIYKASDQVVTNVTMDANVNEVKAKLKLDETHPFFFDHPLDHVPGGMVIEGLWQMLDRVTAEVDPDNPTLHRYLSNVTITFRRWIEKELPTPLSLLLMDGGPDALEFAGIVMQMGYIACELDMTISYGKAPDYAPREPGPRQKAPKELLHKLDANNVLISPVSQGAHNEFVCDVLAPGVDHIFYDACFIGTEQRKSVSPLYLLEAARQLTTHLGHSHYGVPQGHPMNLISVDMEISRPISFSDWLQMSHKVEESSEASLQDIIRFEIVIRSQGQQVGVVGITAQAVDKDTYRKQRGLDESQ